MIFLRGITTAGGVWLCLSFLPAAAAASSSLSSLFKVLPSLGRPFPCQARDNDKDEKEGDDPNATTRGAMAKQQACAIVGKQRQQQRRRHPFSLESSHRQETTVAFRQDSAAPSRMEFMATRRGSAVTRTSDKLENEAEPTTTKNRFWPPFPFNVIQQQWQRNAPFQKQNSVDGVTPSGASVVWKYVRQRARTDLWQLQQLGSDLSLHLPPATPCLILLAILPMRRPAAGAAAAATAASEGAATAVMGPFMRLHVFSRRLALSSLGIAVISLTTYQWRQKKRLVSLPLSEPYQDLRRAVLPPFLPEELAPLRLSDVLLLKEVQEKKKEEDEEDATLSLPQSVMDDVVTNTTSPLSIRRLQRHVRHLYKAAPKPTSFATMLQEWRLMRRVKSREVYNVKRAAIREELLALQSLKRKAKEASRKGRVSGRPAGRRHTESSSLGFALVTGASEGIGRALAVELARYEIPLILVARNVPKLRRLADDLQECYGVSCVVLGADLSRPRESVRIYNATRAAGLRVDLLVNNAGVCTYRPLVDTFLDDVDRLLQINVGAVSSLCRLYGRDMREAGRGRILIVSSVVGVAPSGPGVATYAASKAFERSLASSLAKELEPFGVGVTCLLPGAVAGTQFATGSNDLKRAVCFRLPGYAVTAPRVARRGVTALLAGHAESMPGWMNRVLFHVGQPLLPRRLLTHIVEWAWSPLPPPPLFWGWWPGGSANNNNNTAATTEPPRSTTTPRGTAAWKSPDRPPPMLELPAPDDDDDTDENPKEEDWSLQTTMDDREVLSVENEEEEAAMTRGPREEEEEEETRAAKEEEVSEERPLSEKAASLPPEEEEEEQANASGHATNDSAREHEISQRLEQDEGRPLWENGKQQQQQPDEDETVDEEMSTPAATLLSEGVL